MNTRRTAAIAGTISKRIRGATLPAVLLTGILCGYWIRGAIAPEPPPHSLDKPRPETQAAAQAWTCSMHPHIRHPEPGPCPLCGMDLIPVRTGGEEDAGPRTYVTSVAAKALMDLQTARVERRFVESEVRMVGKIEYDETRLATISAWVPGRIDRLFVDYTGIQVRKGDHMVSLYSPELLTAQQELRTAVEARGRVSANAPQVLLDTLEATVSGAREKLRRWGLTDAQIRAVENKGVLSDHVTVYAPIGGTVIARNGTEGMYVETGTTIYTIADLSHVWVKLDAYEADLPWLHYGQTAHFTAEAYPGETFAGKIAFIEPLVDAKTRTVKLRVNLPNADARLKPGMFVRAVVRSEIATHGRVRDPGLAGKWISPMHPEIVKDQAGTCDICGMPLVRAEELGYVPHAATDADRPLVIPASAPLITGKRAVVYVAVPGTQKPTFEGREVVLGPRAGNFYLVESGLEEGDIAVTNGNFKIDSALQILAKPSMMNPAPETGVPAPLERIEAPASFQALLRAAVEAYYPVQQALANDDAPVGAKAATALREALDKVDMALLSGDAHREWMGRLKALEQALAAFQEAGVDIARQRSAFETLSHALIQTVDQFGLGPGAETHVVHCPMAFDNKGADWLQAGKEVRNPYFGAAMVKCGAVTRSIGATADAGDHVHE